MPKCPKCKEEIDYLDFKEEQVNTGQYSIDDGYGCDTNYRESDSRNTEFSCPECGEKLFDNEEDAIEFLEGGGKWVSK